MQARCCCGKYDLDECDVFVVNDTQHERLGPAGNFCGPVYKHDLRDLQEKVEKAEAQAGVLQKEKELLFDAHSKEMVRADLAEAQIAKTEEEKADILAENIVLLGQMAESRADAVRECEALARGWNCGEPVARDIRFAFPEYFGGE